MDFNEYQRLARTTAIYHDKTGDISYGMYPAMEAVEEAGELLGKIKKAWRKYGDNFLAEMTPDEMEAAILEASDVLWPLANFCTDIGISFDYLAKKNLDKLRGRMERGTLDGEGDDR